MLTLGIETSCDETSVAFVEDGQRVVSCVIASSQKSFAHMGGVIPEYAARSQLESILPTLQAAEAKAGKNVADCDLIAVTAYPGLLGSLLVGTATARTLSFVHKIPLIPVHHTLGHLDSTWLHNSNDTKPCPAFPILTLSVSGGHSDIWHRTSHTTGEKIGTTRDDAAGEAFDKGAMLLGLPYPGGPVLAKLAQSGDASTHKFPLPLEREPGCNFSFSGLKTALKYRIEDCGGLSALSEQDKANLAASYEAAIIAHLMRQLRRALEVQPDVREIHIVGGVAANVTLRNALQTLGESQQIVTRFPATILYCTDNAAMIAAAGTFLARERPATINAPFVTSATKELENVLSSNS